MVVYYISYRKPPLSQHTSQTLDQDSDKTPTNLRNSNDNDEYDPDIPSTNSQQSTTSIKTSPIVIKIQPHGKSQSTQPIISTRPADMTFEDEKISDSDQITSSQKDVNPIQETPWIVSNEKKRT
ncbi:unnamed protein product [Rotaria sp. Silwood1]|nr:unnamed protein product [Rotaria sp. Silwood1]CAF4855567.1 unnamed protein product [Rotaria sp. Silwood1]CAF4955401.1 unnamed protein product [Rotaria sp. Silwood1]